MLTLWMTMALAMVPALTAPPAPTAPPADLGPLPWVMWALPAVAYVRHKAEPTAELAGALRHGDQVKVVEVVANPEGVPTWAMLDGLGAVVLASLRPIADRPLEAKMVAADAQFTYGRVIQENAAEFALPDPKSKRLKGHAAKHLLAFVPNPDLQAKGWLWRAGGGYLRVADMEMLTLSAFAGEPNPVLPLAFVRRHTRLRSGDKSAALPVFVNRYERMTVTKEQGGFAWVKGGLLPRSRVRVAYASPRPAEIPAGSKWLHIDLAEQTVVAYEGDKAVLATLMSSGRSPHQTTQGVFRFYAKTIHSTMRGDGAKGYVAEEVPYVMHFFEGQAMHGAYWHDQFGIVKSHGCLNMAPADAKWLFEWVPPGLPAGWHGRLLGKGETGGYLEIDSTSAARRARLARKVARAGLAK